MQARAEVSAANQQRLRDSMIAVPDADFTFSFIELSELLEHACLTAATKDGVLMPTEYDANVARVLSAFETRGGALLLQLAGILEQIEAGDTHVNVTMQQVLDLCAA